MPNTPKLIPEIKAAWVAKLREGLPQTTGNLRNELGYCCLGVLGLEVMGLTPEPLMPKDHESLVFGFLDADGQGRGYTPLLAAFQDPAGLNDNAFTPFWHKNDGVGGRQWTFAEIANFIEENY